MEYPGKAEREKTETIVYDKNRDRICQPFNKAVERDS